MNFIDVSEYQGEINWKRVRASGIKAAYLKASQGTSWVDPDFHKNRLAANAAGIHIGAYHFADVYDGVLEAKHFFSAIGHVGPKDLKPVLDFETNPKNLRPIALEKFAVNFSQKLKSLVGVYPMFYSYAAFIENVGFPKPIGNGLWIAAYGRNDGKEYPVFAPKPWKRYIAHQFTSKGHVPGIVGNVDVSVSPNGLLPLLAHPIRNAITRF